MKVAHHRRIDKLVLALSTASNEAKFGVRRRLAILRTKDLTRSQRHIALKVLATARRARSISRSDDLLAASAASEASGGRPLDSSDSRGRETPTDGPDGAKAMQHADIYRRTAR